MRQDEASVEEILASIKKVIARDNREIAAEQRRRQESAGVTRQDNPPEPADLDEADEVLDLSEADFAEEVGDAPEHIETADHDSNADPADDCRPLINESSRVSMRDSFAALAMLAEPGQAPQIVRSGETSLEGLTRELLRPMLAEWMDRNLPVLVERLVAAEIARIAGKRG